MFYFGSGVRFTKKVEVILSEGICGGQRRLGKPVVDAKLVAFPSFPPLSWFSNFLKLENKFLKIKGLIDRRDDIEDKLLQINLQ